MSSTPSPPPDVQQTLDRAFSHLVSTKYYVLVSSIMLVYDHILTFEQERAYIWNRKKTIPSYLFFIFRYFALIITLLNLVAQHNPRWTGSICRNWIWFPVSGAMITGAATGVILIMRVHAIYSRSKWILVLLVPVYLGELAVMGWSIPSGVPAKMPAGFVGCMPAEEPGTGRRLPAMFIAALVFDTVIFLLTLSRALFMSVSSRRNLPLLTLIVRDGTLYFMVIFVVNLVNVFLFAFATPDLSAINAPLSTMITAVLVARLVLNLREAAQKMIIHKSMIMMDPSVDTGPNVTSCKGTPVNETPSTGFVSSFIGLDEFHVDLGCMDYDTDPPNLDGTQSQCRATMEQADGLSESARNPA